MVEFRLKQIERGFDLHYILCKQVFKLFYQHRYNITLDQSLKNILLLANRPSLKYCKQALQARALHYLCKDYRLGKRLTLIMHNKYGRYLYFCLAYPKVLLSSNLDNRKVYISVNRTKGKGDGCYELLFLQNNC